MSGKSQQDYIAEILGLMAMKQFLPDSISAEDRRTFEAPLSRRAAKLVKEYAAAREEVAGLAADDARRKEFDKRTENLAKALPGITKGTLAAISAFQKNDPINGSAAVMDICASLAPMLGALSAAGGPPGMLVGAIFAMVGQILSFFAPKSESLTSQIAKLLKDLQADEKARQIKAVHTSITNYASSLNRATGRIEAALSKPGLQIMVISQIIRDFNPIDGPTINKFWEVAEWLQEEKNQGHDQWPNVLAGMCQAYMDLMSTIITVMSLVSTDAMQERFDESEKLPADKGSEVRRVLTELLALATARLIEYGACNDAQLEYLRQSVAPARDRGMLWQIDDSDKGHLWAGTNIHLGSFKYLGGEAKRIAVAVAKEDLASASRTYHAVALEPWIDQGWKGYDRTYHCVVKAPYDSMAAKQLGSLHAVTDVWATSAAGENKKEVYLYLVKAKELQGYALGADGSLRSVYSRTLKVDARAVRVVHDPSSVSGDPDGLVQAAGKPKLDFIAYAGAAASSQIYVDASGKEGYVPSPWGGYSGLGVDQDFVWVYRADGLACATHASVMRCLRGEIAKPRWMAYDPAQLLYTAVYGRDQGKVRDPKPLKGLVDLCACDDGTLVAALYTRSVVEQPPAVSSWPQSSGESVYVFKDANALYGAVHEIDVKNGTIAVTWTKLGRATGVRVQKLPVFCWSLFESLRASLDALAVALTETP
jgi:hypothetical protein